MRKDDFVVLGVMSGTSLDGIDLCLSRFCKSDNLWKFDIQKAETIPYSNFWTERLSRLVDMKPDELRLVDSEYTALIAETINAFFTDNAISGVDFISSHGHTALHMPDKGITYQIGNLPELAKLTGYNVVCDFRVQDVELGGQGAPLVPIGDQLLFAEHDFCLNLGGFANISMSSNGRRIAFDICPVNIVLNALANQRGFDFDDSGKLAASGQIEAGLLTVLNQLEYYRLPYPKSLGFEWIKEIVSPILDGSERVVEDKLKTFTEHIAIQIAQTVNGYDGLNILVTGGGAYNRFLMERLKHHSEKEIIIPSKIVIEYKEALIFGLLGVLRMRGENNILSSVTGAKRDHCSGKVFNP